MISALLLSVMTTSVVHAGAQDCGHGYAACNYGYGFAQRACMSCQYGPGCSPTRAFNYRLAMDYPWTVPSYARAKALMQGSLPLSDCAPEEPIGNEVRIGDDASVSLNRNADKLSQSKSRAAHSSRRTARLTSVK
jgi:hypothetical protein